MVRHGWIVAAVLFASLVSGPRPVEAAPAPYSDWVFDLGRAQSGLQPATMKKLIVAQPQFARIWFYGQILDLATEGISTAEKAKLRVQLELIANLLGQQSEPDATPKLLLDQANSGTLAPLADRVRTLQKKWFNLAVRGQTLPVKVAVIESPDLARIVFYTYLYRSEIAVRRLGGPRYKRQLLSTAQALAEGFALIDGDMVPWQVLSKFYGTGGVPVTVKGLVEQQIVFALNDYVAGKAASAKAKLFSAFATARKARGGSLMVALVMNGAAHASVWEKDYENAKSLRTQVLQGIRPLKNVKLTGLIVRQMIAAHLKAKQIDDVVGYSRELRESGASTFTDRRTLKVLADAAQALDTEARRRFDAGQLSGALRCAEEAAALWGTLAGKALIARSFLSTEVDGIHQRRVIRRAEMHRLAGHIAHRRGEYDGARAIYEKAIALYDGIGQSVGAAAIETDLSKSILANGDADQACARTESAERRLGPQGDPLLRAQNFLILARAQRVQGHLFKALNTVDGALKVLKESGRAADAQPLQAQLHMQAAALLDESGQNFEALERIKAVSTLAPKDPVLVGYAAAALSSAGDTAAALAAVQPLTMSPDSQTAIVYQGCLLTDSERIDEGLAMLSILVPQLTLPNRRATQLLGRSCLAWGLYKKGRYDEAGVVTAKARAQLMQYPEPGLVWRFNIIDGALSYAKGQWLDAAGSWRQAIDRFVEYLGEQSWRGIALDYRSVALPRTIDPILADLPAAFYASAESDQANAFVHVQAALRMTRWVQQWRFAPQHRAFAPNQAIPATVRTTRNQLSQLSDLSTRLADSALDRVYRIRLAQRYREVAAALPTTVASTRFDRMAQLDVLSPVPSNIRLPETDALMRYYVGEEESFLWLVAPGEFVRQYRLPGRVAIGQLLKPAHAVIYSPPALWDTTKKRPKDPNSAAWKVLKKPVGTLLPFMKDRAAMKALENRRIRCIPDGPLVRFPLNALVVERPKRRPRGSAPTFVGERLDIQYSLLQQSVPNPPIKGQGRVIVGPLAEAQGGCPTSLLGNPCAKAQIDGRIAAFETGLGEGLKAEKLSEAKVTSSSIQAALRTKQAAYIFAPVDLMAGTIVTSPDGPNLPLGRLEPQGLIESAGGSREILLGNGIGSALPLETGDGFRRLSSALRAMGVENVVVVDGTVGGEDSIWFEYLGRIMQPGGELRDSIRLAQRFAMTAPVNLEDPLPVVLHHPYSWARWLVYSASMAPKAGTDFTAPLDVFRPKIVEPTSPYDDLDEVDSPAVPPTEPKATPSASPDVRRAPSKATTPGAATTTPSESGPSTKGASPSAVSPTGTKAVSATSGKVDVPPTQDERAIVVTSDKPPATSPGAVTEKPTTPGQTASPPANTSAQPQSGLAESGEAPEPVVSSEGPSQKSGAQKQVAPSTPAAAESPGAAGAGDAAAGAAETSDAKKPLEGAKSDETSKSPKVDKPKATPAPESPTGMSESSEDDDEDDDDDDDDDDDGDD